ncbi:hypothetical protein IFM89_025743, partial [Coptis chinensis]
LKPINLKKNKIHPMEVQQDFVYETLAPLSTDSPQLTESPEPYSVFRNQVSSSSSSLSTITTTTTTPTTDYFSLDVSNDDIDLKVAKQEPTPIENREFESNKRVLESGWFSANGKFKSPMLQLHKEILDFCEFLSPTLEEQAARNAAVEGVFGVIKHIWPNCNVEVFGSFKTGLYLPTSDIDVVILDSNVKTPQIGLVALSRALTQRGIAKKMQVIAKARVPIIKFIEKRSGVAFDISFDVQNGPKAAVFIKDAISRIPALRPLCLILKVFLQQRELNEVYSGGIGSYALLTMLIAQLQMHWKGQYYQSSKASPEQNLGILLVNFFDFYGRKLNIYDVGVSCKDAGTFFLKNRKGFLNEDRPYLLSIEDPQAPENDIGRSSFNFSQIRSAFGMAFSTLTNEKTILSLGCSRSILGTIIRPDSILLERKGGANGEVTFDSLLPGAGEPLLAQEQSEQEMMFNWQFDEEEPLPRQNGNLGVDSLNSSGKRKKVLREKRVSLSNGREVVQRNYHANKLRKRWKSQKNADDGNGGGNSSGHYVSGSPWGRSH